ncbi:MAG TPA: hypothetical protein VFA18_17540, partial [Gemmataceae bacterium]|nr:hypothetical protein [Gemmataceae bacterium]
MNPDLIIKAVQDVTAPWAKHRKREERDTNARRRREQALLGKHHRVTLKQAASEVMPRAYLAASTQGTLPATARQIFYKARPPILERTDQSDLRSEYFTQTLLPNYIMDHPGSTESWDVVWDDRGHFTEPHTDVVIGLGTIAVREYLADVTAGVADEGRFLEELERATTRLFPTAGPDHRFQAVLIVEKEGFFPLFEAVHLAERFDIAIMSSKGQN